MATLSLDVVILVRSDTKSTPRVRSFRERVRGALLCASETPVHLMGPHACSLHEHGSAETISAHQPEANVQARTKTAFRMQSDAIEQPGEG